MQLPSRHRAVTNNAVEDVTITAPAVEPPEDVTVPMRVSLIVEPTPFTHVSGYANRFKEYLKYQKKAGADVSIITPDDSEDAPSEFSGFPITTVRGFRFVLYPVISMAWGIAPAEGLRLGMWRRFGPMSWFVRRKNKREYFSRVAEVVDEFEPELVHVTSPGFIPVISSFIAREWKDIPLLISYHTHIPVYSRVYAPWMGAFGEWLSWYIIRKTHEWADLTVVTSPQLKQEFLDHGIEKVEVWNKGIDTVVFHPKHGAKEWWTASAAGIAAARESGDDPAVLAAKARETREKAPQLFSNPDSVTRNCIGCRSSLSFESSISSQKLRSRPRRSSGERSKRSWRRQRESLLMCDKGKRPAPPNIGSGSQRSACGRWV